MTKAQPYDLSWMKNCVVCSDAVTSAMKDLIASGLNEKMASEKLEAEATKVSGGIVVITAGAIKSRYRNLTGKKVDRRRVCEPLLSPAERHATNMSSVKSNYGLSESELQEMMNQQKGQCKICGADLGLLDKRSCIDHCHTTGQIRGLLCSPCNKALAGLEYFNDNGLTAEVEDYIS